MLPHGIRAVGDKPAVFHPAGKGEPQVHTDVIIKRPVIGGRIGTERAVPVFHLALDGLSLVNQTTTLFYLLD